MRKAILVLMLSNLGQILAQVTITGDRIDLTHAQATRPVKIVATLPTGVPPQLPCVSGDMVLLTSAPLGSRIYINSATGACVWTQQTGGGGGGGGLADPGANGVIKRTAPNVTAPALSSDVITLFSGCVGVMLLGADGACHSPSSGVADPGSNGIMKRTSLNVTAPAAFSDVTTLFSACTGSPTQFLGADGVCHTAAGGLGDPGSNGIVKRTAFNVSAHAISTDVIGLFTACSGLGTQYLGADGACHMAASPVSGGSYVTASTSSPQTISAATHGQGINADVFCFSGAVSGGTTTGHQVLCDYSKDASGNVTITWASSVVSSIQVFASGAGPAGPPGPGGAPGGISGQIQYNNAGSFAGFTAGGDATVNTGTGAVVVTKTNGVAFAASATTNTTIATNITSGILPVPRGGTGVGTLTGLAKGNGTGVFTAGGVTDITSLFGSCSGSQLLGFDGICHNSTGTPAGVSTDLQYNNAGAFGAIHPPATAGFPRWNGSTTWAIGDIPVGSSGGLDCSTTHGQCDIVTTVVPRFGFNWLQNGLVNFLGSSSTAPNRAGTGSPNGRDTCVNVGETYFQTDAVPGGNVWGCTGTGIGAAAAWTLEGAGGSGGLPYVINSSGTSQTILAATHNQGINPWVFCWSGALSSGATTGNLVGCSVSKIANGDVTITWTGSTVASIEVMAAGGTGGGGGSFGPVLTSAPITGGPITTTGTISCPTCATTFGAMHPNAIVTSNGAQGVTTPAGNSTIDSFGDIVTIGYMFGAGGLFCSQTSFGGSPSVNSFGFVCPTSIPSAYQWMLPSADAAGVVTSDGAGSPGHLSISPTTGSGNILRASAAAPATSGTVPLKGNGSGGFSAASATDIANLFASCSSGTQYLGFDGFCHAAAGSGLNDPGANGIVKRTAPNTTAPAVAGTDYAAPPSGSTILKANGSGGFSSASPTDVVNLFSGCLPGPDYLGADGACHLPTGSPGGTNGQIQYNSSGAFAGLDANGDATISTSPGTVGRVTVTKTNGTPFAASATIDTTDASHITAGLLPVPRGGTGAGTLAGLLRGNGTSAIGSASSTDVIALFGACSGVQYLGADGACHALSAGANPLLPAVKGAGTITVVGGTTVSGFGTNFSTVFPLCTPTCTHGESLAIYPPTATQSGHFAVTPLPGQNLDNNGEASSLIWGVDGTTFAITPGDSVTPIRNYSQHSGIDFSSYTPVYPGAAYTQPEFWSVTLQKQSNLLMTAIPMYPAVGSRYPYPYISVPFGGGSAYLIMNAPHNLPNGANVTVSGSPGGAWDGTYNVLNNSFNVSNPAASCVLVTTNPRGLTSGIYAVDGLSMTSGAAIGNAPTVSIVVSAGTATATFLYPHGFSINDAIHISGFTGWGGSASATVATVGNNDWPKTLTFATSAANGTYANQAGVISIGYKLTPRPSWVAVNSVSSNTALNLLSSVASTGGAAWYSAPDNFAAFETMTALKQDVLIPQGDYYFNNLPSNTLQADGSIQVAGWSNYMGGTSGVRFILARPQWNGFQFHGGSNAVFDKLTVETLYQVPNTICAFPASCFPASFGIYEADRPRVLNISSNISTSNFLDIESATDPQVIGFRIRNVGLGGCYVIAASTHPVLSNGLCENDNDGQSIFMQNNFNDQNMRGAVLSNIVSINTGPALWFGVPDVLATNMYMEGAQTGAIGTEVDNGTTGNIRLNNIQINNNATLGPADQIYGTYALNVTGALTGVTVNGLSIRNSFGDGINIASPTDISISNSLVDSVGWDCMQIASGAVVRLSNVTLSSCGGMALVNLGGTVTADGLTIKNVNQIYNPGYPGAFSGTSMISAGGFGDFRGLRVIDTQVTATSYILQCSPCRVKDSSAQITDTGHPLQSTGTAGQAFFTQSGITGTLFTSGLNATLATLNDTFTLGGTGTIQNITYAPGGAMQAGDQLCAIPGGSSAWTTVIGGNIGAASTPAVGRMICWRYASGSWWPSY